MNWIHRALVVLLISMWATVPAAAKPKVVTYTVQQGDSVWSIAEEFYGDGRRYPLIYRYNKFRGKPPHLLIPGQVLRLPVGEIGPEAHMNWLLAEVKAKPPRSIEWIHAHAKMNLWRLYKVSTGDESAAQIVFEDESDLTLRDNALLVIYGATAARTATQRLKKTRVLLERGTLRGGLAKLDGDSEPIIVETPSGDVAVKSKETQVEAQATTSAISVYDGKANVSNPQGTVEVPKGFGTVVEKGKKPQKPRPLPRPPRWDKPGDKVVVVREGGTGRFEAAWAPAKNAYYYRVELAHDRRFKNVIIGAEVGRGVTRFRAQDIKAGSYFARIMAISRSRLESRGSRVLRVEVVEVASARRLTPGQGVDTKGFEVIGFTSISPKVANPKLQVAVDEGDFAPADKPVRLHTPGDYRLRYRLANSPAETIVPIRVVEPTTTFHLADGAVDTNHGPLEGTLAIVDDHGSPVELPGLHVEAAPGGELPLTRAGPGKYKISVPLARNYSRVAVRAKWLGGELAQSEIKLAPPPKIPAVKRFAFPWPLAPTALVWNRRHLATPLPSPQAVDHVGIKTTLLTQPLDAIEASLLAVSLAGEWALADGDLGLDADMTLFRPVLSPDDVRVSEIGDIRLGVRLLAADLGIVQLAPMLRVTVPTAGKRSGALTFGFEPGFLTRFRIAKMAAIDVRNAVVAQTDFGDATTLSYAATLAGILRPNPRFSLTAQIDAAVSLVTPMGTDGFAAFAAGGGLWLHFGRVRVGANLGAGIGSDGQAQFGDLTVGLGLHIGLGGPSPEETAEPPLSATP